MSLQSPLVLLLLFPTESDTYPFSLTICGLLVRYSVIQVIVETSTCVFWSVLHSKAGRIMLNALEKSKSVIITALPVLFRW